MVKFLREHLEKAGCAIGDNFIKAINCDQKMAGGYAPGQGVSLLLNSDYTITSFDEFAGFQLFPSLLRVPLITNLIIVGCIS